MRECSFETTKHFFNGIKHDKNGENAVLQFVTVDIRFLEQNSPILYAAVDQLEYIREVLFAYIVYGFLCAKYMLQFFSSYTVALND